MKISVKVEYKDKEYVSDTQEVNKDQMEAVELALESISKGAASYFTIDIGDKKVYFGEEILKHSILTLTRK